MTEKKKTLRFFSCPGRWLGLMGLAVLASCSSTSYLDDGDELFTGLKPIKYEDYESCDHFIATQEEMEAALATAPNGALFGSSYYRTPFPYGLWIYNACYGKNNGFAKWLNKTFGKAPVLMSNVNPELRVSVANNVLQNNGYFRGNVDYEILEGKPRTTRTDTVARPRTAKIAYTVDLGHLFTFDSISYSNFPEEAYNMLRGTESLLHTGDPFGVSVLDEERTRIYNLFRNHGYYYYQQSYTSYLADTLKVPGKVQLQLHMVDSLPDDATMKWVIGRVDVNIRRQSREALTDTVNRRLLTVHFGGKRPPIRPRVILSDVKLFPGQLFSQEAYEESQSRLYAKGIYSSIGIDFTKRLNEDGSIKVLSDTVSSLTRDGQNRKGAGVLDMSINCVLDKPYDFTMQANYLGKTSGRMGPGASIGFAKRNAFRGGEVLGLNLSGSYEFQTGSGMSLSNSNYELAGDLTLTMPRLLLPKFVTGNKRRRWQTTPSTIISVSRETINRNGFFRRHILSGELSYLFQPNSQVSHQVSPIIVEYDRLATVSEDYKEKAALSPVLMSNMDDYFLTKMRYTYRYSSPTNYRNPIYLQATLTESSNILALGYLVTGKKWNDKDKTAFKAPFSQFVKAELDWRKTWMLDEYTSAIAHVQVGAMKCYGNSDHAPFSEYFYVGGANSLRAFSARGVGPGRSYSDNQDYDYVNNNGSMKFVVNLEYRPRLFGSLYGALFLDAGNVWDFDDESRSVIMSDESTQTSASYAADSGRTFKLNKFLTDLAVGAGVGIRYDLDFFVLRLDWGFVIHNPRGDSKSGYFNFPGFSKGQCLNFAIGYPF